jgi:hypothetical protein
MAIEDRESGFRLAMRAVGVAAPAARIALAHQLIANRNHQSTSGIDIRDPNPESY